MSDARLRLFRALATALRTDDPVRTLRDAAEQEDVSAADRELLAAASADGVRLSALLIANLRFQRLRNGSREAAEWFARDARGFVAAFKDYARDVLPSEPTPQGEARLFDAWLSEDLGTPPERP